MIDNLRYGRTRYMKKLTKPNSTRSEQLVSRKRKQQSRVDTNVFPTTAQAVDAKADLVSPTMALLAVTARDVVRRNIEDSRHTCRLWHQVLEEPLAYVTERHFTPFTIFPNNVPHSECPT